MSSICPWMTIDGDAHRPREGSKQGSGRRSRFRKWQ